MTAFTVYDAFSATNNENVIWDIGTPGSPGADREATITAGDLQFAFWDDDFSAPFVIPTNTYRIRTDRLDSYLDILEMFDVTTIGETNFTLSVSGAGSPSGGYYLGGLNSSLYNVGSSDNFNGDIAEFICYSGYLNDGERESVTSYLQQKYYEVQTNNQPIYQWQLNGTNIPNATQPTLVLTNVPLSDSGSQFTCVITNSYGAVTSSVVTLIVNYGLSTLYFFSGSNGQGPGPVGRLIQTSDGTFYGTTIYGGAFNHGSVFKVATNVALTTVASLDGSDGANPSAGLAGQGDYYGTAFAGGADGLGSIFSLDTNANMATVVSFNGANGSGPDCDLLPWPDGSFYGTTYYGGDYGYGTVFNLTTNGIVTSLYSFDIINGGSPEAGLVAGGDGCLYGTASGGGTYNDGVVFKITTAGLETVLYSFDDTNGAGPTGALLLGLDGNFYGTTQQGGPGGSGTVFRLSSDGMLTTVVAFDSMNGATPASALIQDSAGNRYGTTQFGGLYGDGTVFKLAVDGTFTTLINFAGTNGSCPYAPLTLGADGNLYGTTAYGGNAYYGAATNGLGTVFCVRLPALVPVRPAFSLVNKLPGGGLQLAVTGAVGQTFHVLASTNLQDWSTIATLTNLSGSGQCTLDISTNGSQFFELVQP